MLLVDDDPSHLDIVHELLAPLGFVLLTAPDGPGGLALARNAGPISSCSTSRCPA